MELESLPTTIDLTGLPEPVVREVQRIVYAARQKQAGESPVSRPETKPERRPLLGRFADLGISISKEEIDELQRELWATFPRDFPDPAEQ